MQSSCYKTDLCYSGNSIQKNYVDTSSIRKSPEKSVNAFHSNHNTYLSPSKDYIHSVEKRSSNFELEEIFSLIISIPKDQFPQKERLYHLVKQYTSKDKPRYSSTSQFSLDKVSDKVFMKKTEKTRAPNYDLSSHFDLKSRPYSSNNAFFNKKYEHVRPSSTGIRPEFTSLKQHLNSCLNSDSIHKQER